MDRNNYKMSLTYDGTGYSGWQKQKNTKSTIQGILEMLISGYLKEKIEIHGSGRTDKGVHALCQTANFLTDQSIDLNDFHCYMNRELPADIRMWDVGKAAVDFHSRYSAKAKCYEYRIGLDGGSVFSRKYEYCLDGEPDLGAMKRAAGYLLGCHDFTGFSAKDGSGKSKVRELYRIQFTKEKNSMKILFYGNGFLYRMVRILSGTLMEVGMNRIDAEQVKEVLVKKDRSGAGFTAPAHGLFLIGAEYDGYISKDICERLGKCRRP